MQLLQQQQRRLALSCLSFWGSALLPALGSPPLVLPGQQTAHVKFQTSSAAAGHATNDAEQLQQHILASSGWHKNSAKAARDSSSSIFTPCSGLGELNLATFPPCFCKRFGCHSASCPHVSPTYNNEMGNYSAKLARNVSYNIHYIPHSTLHNSNNNNDN